MSANVPSVAERLQAAEKLAHAGQFGQAEAAAAEVLRRAPGNAHAQYILGLSALFQKRYPEALERMDRALSADAGHSQYHFGRALCLASLQRVDDAVASYRRALELRPNFFEAAANMGNLLENAGRFAPAAEAYRRALALRPDQPLVLNGLGLCELAQGRVPEAIEALEHALRVQPDFPQAGNNLATAIARLGDNRRAVELLRRAVALRPRFVEAWINLGEQLYVLREDAAAIEAFDRVLALEPSNDEVRYLRNAIAGVAMERAPDAFVSRFFDRFAAEFDQRLTQDLDYRMPQALAEFLLPQLEGREALRVADLGCGTGLSGVFVRPKAAFLAGVDLSEKMLARARERGIYDELVRDEIAAYLDRMPPASFDLALAVDVFVYAGNLEPILRACARVLGPGGLFAFSTERLDDPGESFRLARTGRYAHSPAYVARAVADAGLRIVRARDAVIRKEDGAPVRGELYAIATGA